MFVKVVAFHYQNSQKHGQTPLTNEYYTLENNNNQQRKPVTKTFTVASGSKIEMCRKLYVGLDNYHTLLKKAIVSVCMQYYLF